MSLHKFLVLLAAYYIVVFVAHAVILNSGDDQEINLHIVDVGQGDGIYIDIPRAGKVVIDAGPDNNMDVFIDNVALVPDCELDLLILTHPHLDHLGGFSQLLKRCRIEGVMFNDVDFSSRAFFSFKDLIAKNSTIKKVLHEYFADQKINFGELDIYILWPTKDFLLNHKNEYIKDLNKMSGVFLLDYKDFEALITGDAEAEVLNEIDFVKYKPLIQGALDVLKVPHHGSANGMNEHLLLYLRPKTCVISVGQANKYNHPSPSTLSLLNKHCAYVRRTDLEGTIELKYSKML